MYKFLIVDDDIEDLLSIKKFLDKELQIYSIECNILVSNNPESIDFKQAYDAIFLDIEMSGINGFDITNKLTPLPPIIYISHRDDLGYQACNYHPYGFVRKQYLTQELPPILKRLIIQINQYFSIDYQYHRLKILYRDILYFQSDKHYIYIHTLHHIYKIRDKLSNIYETLNHKDFVYCHQSFIVNFRYILNVDNKEVILKNNEIIPISQRKSKDTENLFQQFQLRKL